MLERITKNNNMSKMNEKLVLMNIQNISCIDAK